ncbi:hypothetical protein HZH66_014987 [Vespula vulgaris]|uniref:Uncharacterized protein n=1 Tax=Vespula vulgaris TaxID=7454 RepID=A0A834MQ32_VESVU|nr:hypothetical protein HZH66_014987 [Vespula vulgaris]
MRRDETGREGQEEWGGEERGGEEWEREGKERNETKQDEKERDKTKRNETKRNETRRYETIRYDTRRERHPYVTIRRLPVVFLTIEGGHHKFYRTSHLKCSEWDLRTVVRGRGEGGGGSIHGERITPTILELGCNSDDGDDDDCNGVDGEQQVYKIELILDFLNRH